MSTTPLLNLHNLWSHVPAKQMLIEYLQRCLMQLSINLRIFPLQPAPTSVSNLFCLAVSQCRTSPQFLYVPFDQVRCEDVPLLVRQGAPSQGWLCEVCVGDIYLGVGLGSTRGIARDRAIVRCLNLLSSGPLSLLPMVRRWAGNFYPVIGLATHLYGRNIHLPPFYSTPANLLVYQQQQAAWDFTASNAHFGPAVSDKKISDLVLLGEAWEEAAVDVLKKSAELSNVAIDMFAEKTAGQDEFIWTVFVEGEAVADARGGKTVAKTEVATEALKILSKQCACISVEWRQVDWGNILNREDARQKAADIMKQSEKVISSDNVGYQLLLKMGYTEGGGLGREESGIARPVVAFGQGPSRTESGNITVKEVEVIIKEYIKTDSVEDLVFNTNFNNKEWALINQVALDLKFQCKREVPENCNRNDEVLIVSKKFVLQSVVEQLERSSDKILYLHGARVKLLSDNIESEKFLSKGLRFQYLRQKQEYPSELVQINERLKLRSSKKSKDSEKESGKKRYKTVHFEYSPIDVPNPFEKKRKEMQLNKVDSNGRKVEKDSNIIDHGVLRIIGDRPKGVFVKWVERQYQKICKKSLPEDWCEVLVEDGKVTVSLEGDIVYSAEVGVKDEVNNNSYTKDNNNKIIEKNPDSIMSESVPALSDIPAPSDTPAPPSDISALSVIRAPNGIPAPSDMPAPSDKPPPSDKPKTVPDKGNISDPDKIFSLSIHDGSCGKPSQNSPCSNLLLMNGNRNEFQPSIPSQSSLQPVNFPPSDKWNVCFTSVLYEEDAATSYSYYVQLLQDQNKAKLCLMNKALNSWANVSTDLVREVQAGKLAAARMGKLWYRVKIRHVVGDKCVTAQLLDKGESVIFPLQDLRELPAKFAELPAQAVRVQLSGMLGIVEPHILAECLDWVKELLCGKQFTARLENRSCLDQVGAEPVLSLSDNNLQDWEAGNMNFAILQLVKFVSLNTNAEKRILFINVKNPPLLEILKKQLPQVSTAQFLGEEMDELERDLEGMALR